MDLSILYIYFQIFFYSCGIDNLKDRLSDVEIHQTNFDDFEEKTQLHENTAILLVSHDFYKDYFILEKIITKPVKYIGIMGPKRRGNRMLEEIKKGGKVMIIDAKGEVSTLITSWDELEYFKKMMIHIYGI